MVTLLLYHLLLLTTVLTNRIQVISCDSHTVVMWVFVVTVASFLYRNLSSLLIPDDPIRQILISPIVSSAVCIDCRIENLTEPVTISFNVEGNEVTTPNVIFDNNVFCIGRCIYLCILVLHKVCYNVTVVVVILYVVHQIVCYHLEDGVVKVVVLSYMVMVVLCVNVTISLTLLSC